MGVLNVTPDSFYDGGRYFSPEAAVRRGREMIGEGASLIDIGGESTRPGSDPVPTDKQIARVLPIIEALAPDAILSIDTRDPEVARRCLEAGARIVNDVSTLRNIALAEVAAEHGARMVIMHSRGEPKTMQRNPHYENVLAEVHEELERAVGRAERAGISRERILVDVGIGFGKRLEDNLALLRHLDHFSDLAAGQVLGVSRKSFLGLLGAGETPEDRLEGSLAAAAWGFCAGVEVFRVHDIAATKKALNVIAALNEGKERIETTRRAAW
ncbi:MAG: dihydropteroate synthase [Candidatus Hydrogenedentota bacterium]|nr:MAG: dihydropteroate synthase [Candidatus Hydrogenedentota bacterium]